MGIKNMFKKSSKLFDKEGFYVVLFVCLCIVAVAAVYISKNNANTAKNVAENNKTVVEQKQEPSNAQQVLKEENKENGNNTVQTMNQPNNSTNTSSISTTKVSKLSDNDKYAKGKSTTKAFSIVAPVEGDITKKFDKENLQESKTLQQWETHEGIDIACDIGTEVKAVAEGKVVDVYKDDQILENLKSGFGVTVVIEHENGYRTMYSNLSQEVKVKKGDQVKKGQIIGVVGDTSVREAVSIEGSHLHFVVLKKSGKDFVTVNPEEYLPKKQ